MVFFLCGSLTLFAQWQSIGKIDNSVTAFYADTSTDKFYWGGPFHFFNQDTVVGIGVWNNDTLLPMSCGIGWDCVNVSEGTGIGLTNCLINYQGKLWVLGSFDKADNKPVNGIMYWDGAQWQGEGSGFKSLSNTEGIGFGASVWNDTLLVYGAFDSIAGVLAHGLAKYDGFEWSSVHDLPQFESYSSPNFVYGAILFKGELYIAGNFTNALTTGTINDMAKWNGTEWIGVGNLWEDAAIYNMLIYKDELYISGDFNLLGEPVIAAHNIARFDGETWKTLGGGVDYQVNDMQVFGDYLYIAGVFDNVDGMPIQAIARWDGSRWCGYNSAFDNSATAVGMYHDTLYLGGGFWSINGDTSLRKIVRWIGGDNLTQCGNPVGINDVFKDDFSFSIYPNPANDQLHLSFESPQQKTIATIANMIGEQLVIKSVDSTDMVINISALPSGIYFLGIRTERGFMMRKFMKL
jgi:hypothetical protein